MTCGNGIAHSEESRSGTHDRLHGVQLWVALPDADRFVAASFEHHADRPRVEWAGGARAVVILGRLGSTEASGRMFSPLLAAEIRLDAGSRAEVPLDPGFEHGLVLLAGRASVDGQDLRLDHLLYMDPGHGSLATSATEPARRALRLAGGPAVR
jgi:redox-sensitive bicupin YhaK (pirin superfamily)